MEMSDPKKVEILKKLKDYKKTYECQCLECGYKGPMGVISNGSKIKKVIAFIIAVIAFVLFVPRIIQMMGALVGGIAFALILVITSAVLKANVKTLYCPSCDSILRTK